MPVVRQMLTYIRMQHLIKIYHAVEDLWVFSLTGNGRTDRLIRCLIVHTYPMGLAI